MTLRPDVRRSRLLFRTLLCGLLGLLAFGACGRDTGVEPASPGSVRLDLVFPDGVRLQPLSDSLFASVWVGATRLAGPVAATPAGGRFQVTLPAPAGAERRVAVSLLGSPREGDPAGSTRGVRFLALSDPFDLVPGGTAPVTVTFQPFVTEIVAVEPVGGRNLDIRFRRVPNATRYRAQVWRTNLIFVTTLLADTTVVDTAFTWAVAPNTGNRDSFRLVVRPETTYATGASSPRVDLPRVAEAPALAGRVLADGDPAPNVLVQLLSCPTDQDLGRETFTDAEGRYQFTDLAAGSYRVRIFRGGCTEIFDPPQIVPGCIDLGGELSPGLVTRPDVALTCTTGTQWALCTLTWDEFPQDLDLHLYTPPIPDAESPAYEVYFGDTGSSTAAPFAELDADDVSGFGPENITIYQNFPGDYILAVNNFCCNDTLSQSGARVRIVTPAGAARTIAIAAAQSDAREWWIVARISGTTGAVTVIDTLSTRPPVGGLAPTGLRLESDRRIKEREERR